MKVLVSYGHGHRLQCRPVVANEKLVVVHGNQSSLQSRAPVGPSVSLTGKMKGGLLMRRFRCQKLSLSYILMKVG